MPSSGVKTLRLKSNKNREIVGFRKTFASEVDILDLRFEKLPFFETRFSRKNVVSSGFCMLR